jgi:hypothetical protein
MVQQGYDKWQIAWWFPTVPNLFIDRVQIRLSKRPIDEENRTKDLHSSSSTKMFAK